MEALIYRPAKTATQSGRAKTQQWVLEFPPNQAKRADSLMGWIGSGDTQSQIRLRFDNQEQAVAHAERKGMTYRVRQPNERQLRSKNYADRFRYREVG